MNIPKEKLNELLDELGAKNLIEANVMLELNGPGEFGWDHVIEFYAHEFTGDLKDSFEDYLDKRSEVYDEVKFYYDYGSFREIDPLNVDESKKIERYVNKQIPNQCYYNCQLSMDYKEFSYVEGYVLDNDIRRPVPHAWLEINNKVVEVTLPEKGDLYYGVTFEDNEVREVMIKTEKTGPIVEHKI